MIDYYEFHAIHWTKSSYYFYIGCPDFVCRKIFSKSNDSTLKKFNATNIFTSLSYLATPVVDFPALEFESVLIMFIWFFKAFVPSALLEPTIVPSLASCGLLLVWEPCADCIVPVMFAVAV